MALQPGLFTKEIKKHSKLMDTNEVIGMIMKSDEKSNMVDVEYIDSNGSPTLKENVQVRLYGNGGDWFPNKFDLVICQQKDNNLVVVARFFSDFAAEIRSLMKLEFDKLGDIPNTVIGGLIT